MNLNGKTIESPINIRTRKAFMLSNPYPLPCTSRTLTIVAWIATILMSALPDIAWIQVTGGIPTWLVFIKMALLLILSLAACGWEKLRPLRNFFIALFVFYGLSELRLRFNLTIPALQALFGNSVFDGRMQAEQTGKLIVSLLIIALLLGLGYKRKKFFLTRGNLRAPIDPVPLLGFPKRDLWPWFGLQWSIYIAAAIAVMLYFSLRPTNDLMIKVIPILPSILCYAALNAFNEEITYRSPMLATLEPINGSQHALWMSAFFFGIGHYFGTPGGIVGGIASIFMGWILGKGMVETRGFLWTWWIHFLSDITIFSFMTMALLT
jgi:hypothetical protein